MTQPKKSLENKNPPGNDNMVPVDPTGKLLPLIGQKEVTILFLQEENRTLKAQIAELQGKQGKETNE